MATFSEVALNEALDGVTVDRVSLHDDDPGTTGANEISEGGKLAATFNAASGAARALNADVAFTGLTPGQVVTHFGAWEHNGGDPIFKGGSAIASGDVEANASGEYTLKATSTKLTAAAAS